METPWDGTRGWDVSHKKGIKREGGQDPRPLRRGREVKEKFRQPGGGGAGSHSFAVRARGLAGGPVE